MTDQAVQVIEQRVRIDARPETMWRYWTEPDGTCAWWGTSAELDARPGGVCRVTMEQGPVMSGEFVELFPYERIVFTLGWEVGGEPSPVGPGSTRVEVVLTPDGDGTLLTLRHSVLPADEVGNHTAGWGHFLGILAGAAGR